MIDTGKCIGCQRGIQLFMKKKNGEFIHVDLFFSSEAGANFTCANQEEVAKHLKKNRGKGTYLPDKELGEFYDKQAMWWYTIEDICWEVFKDGKDIVDFFNQGEKGNKMWNQTNEVIEKALLEIAEEKGVEIKEEDYPDLILFKTST